ncbi:hypothetical protein T492DRAFT_941037, partial [Pavlovales sp. CCMP2436]
MSPSCWPEARGRRRRRVAAVAPAGACACLHASAPIQILPKLAATLASSACSAVVCWYGTKPTLVTVTHARRCLASPIGGAASRVGARQRIDGPRAAPRAPVVLRGSERSGRRGERACIRRRESNSSLRVRVRQACALASRDSSTRVHGCDGGDASRTAQPAARAEAVCT